MYFYESFEKLHFFVAVLIATMVASVVTLAFGAITKRRSSRAEDTVSLGIAAIVFIAWYKFGRGESTILLLALAGHSNQLMIAFLTIFAGLFAYIFKLRNQTRYGTIEILFGVVSAFGISLSSSGTTNVFARLTALIGCAYVISRGLGNRFEGRRRETSSETAS
jgi:hypothetical protein